jgi:hypothetical protein
MYSIAAHGDEAIAPLLALAASTKSEHTKVGVAWTVHLIGIDRRIAGRFYEKFRNAKARQALLSLLGDPQLQESVLLLLVRDPWPSDLPELFRQLATDTPHAWGFVKALDRYGIRGAPVHQTLPADVAKRGCGAQWEVNDRFGAMVRALKRSLGKQFVVDQDLHAPPRNPRVRGFGGMVGADVGMALETFVDSSYSTLGYRMEYYLDGDTVHLCSVDTARARWLAWYEEHRGDIKADGPRTPW